VVNLAAYGGPYPGSFIPALAATRAAVESQGWTYEAVFTHQARGRPWHDALQAQGMQTQVVPAMSRTHATRWLRSHVRNRAASLVLHSHFSFWDIPAVLASRRRQRETAVVWHVHTVPQDDPVRTVRNILSFGVAGRGVDRILCVGPDVQDRVLSRLAPRTRTSLFGNAVDVSRFAPAQPQERAAARARLGFPDDGTILLSFCWDWDQKGGPLLLDSVRELRQRGRDALSVIVGSEAHARDGAARRGIADAVRAIPASDDVRDLYAAADLFVSCAEAEAFGWAPLEAVQCGTPVVASDVRGHRFSIGDLPACRLAERTTAAFVAAIESSLNEPPSQRVQQVSDSQAIISRERSVEPWANRLVDVYREVLEC
jgi:glycosyltransferase involved in cell wall biosynthesis